MTTDFAGRDIGDRTAFSSSADIADQLAAVKVGDWVKAVLTFPDAEVTVKGQLKDIAGDICIGEGMCIKFRNGDINLFLTSITHVAGSILQEPEAGNELQPCVVCNPRVYASDGKPVRSDRCDEHRFSPDPLASIAEHLADIAKVAKAITEGRLNVLVSYRNDSARDSRKAYLPSDYRIIITKGGENA